MSDKISVVLQDDNGVSFELSPMSLKLKEKILTPYTQAEFTVRGVWLYYTYCEIHINDTLVFKGYKSSEYVHTTPEGEQTDFVFKSIGSLLEINQAQPKIWTNPSLTQLMDHYLSQLGPFYTTIANTTMGGEFEVSGGISIWTVFLQFMRKMYSNNPHIDINGRLIGMATLKGNTYNASNLPLLSSGSKCKRDGLCRAVYGRYRGFTDFYMLIENGFAKSMGTKRNRLILQENLPLLELLNKARSILLQSNLKNAHGLLTLSGYTPITLWDTVNTDSLNLLPDFIYVGKKEYSYSVDKGGATNLFLYPLSFVDMVE